MADILTGSDSREVVEVRKLDDREVIQKVIESEANSLVEQARHTHDVVSRTPLFPLFGTTPSTPVDKDEAYRVLADYTAHVAGELLALSNHLKSKLPELVTYRATIKGKGVTADEARAHVAEVRAKLADESKPVAKPKTRKTS